MSKKISLFLLIFFKIFNISMVVSQEIIIEDIEGEVGEIIKIPVTFDKVSEFSSFFFEVNYDESILKAYKPVLVETLEKHEYIFKPISNDDMNGTIKCGMFNGKTIDSLHYDLIYLRFEILTNIQHDYQLDFTEFTINEEDHLYNLKIGVITTESNDLFFPNMITPNGDGYNDSFHIKGLYRAYGEQEFELEIYHSKTGNLVFKSNDIYTEWNGTLPNGNPASEGCYFYFLIIDGTKKHEGTLNIVR